MWWYNKYLNIILILYQIFRLKMWKASLIKIALCCFWKKESHVVKKNKILDTLLKDFGMMINLDYIVCQIIQQLF